MTDISVAAVAESAWKVKTIANTLCRFSAQQRCAALESMAAALEENAGEIIEANAADLHAARPDLEGGRMNAAMFNRLKLDAEKLKALAEGIRQVAKLPDPLAKQDLHRELDDGLILQRQPTPIGVVLIIFESRPDALPQIISLLVKTGNAALIKGGKEARHSIAALFGTIGSALRRSDYPGEAFTLLSTREEVSRLLVLDGLIDLVIPRGSGKLVREIQDSTRIPVLGHAEGVCHLYVDRSADLTKALRLLIDAKCQYPSACNSIETLLVHKDIADAFLPQAVQSLRQHNVEVRCEAAAISEYQLSVVQATAEDWSTEYSDLIIAVRVVDSLDQAIAHINKYGSRHTDSIAAEDESACDRFASEVDSAGVFVNASTRFADGYRYGFGAEVGISTSKLHPRGPVGIEGLVTYKYKLIGKGHVVSDYSGPAARRFTHRDL